jgi:hypothetical protein
VLAWLRRLRVVGTVGQGRPWLVHLLARIYAWQKGARHTNPLPSTILKVRHLHVTRSELWRGVA